MSRLQNCILLLIVFAVVELSPAGAALGYELSGPGVKWPQSAPGASVTVTYSYQNMFDGGLKMPNEQPLPNSVIRASIEEAFRLWSSVAPLNFVEVPDYGQIRFEHTYINGHDRPPPLDPWAKAQVTSLYCPGSTCDVQFDDGDWWQAVGTLPIPDILGAATHEIGHTLGLYHTDVVGANMYWIFRRTMGLDDGWLHPDDIAGIRAIYGAGVGSVRPLPIPEPATCAMSIVALFTLLVISRQSAPRPWWGRGRRRQTDAGVS